MFLRYIQKKACHSLWTLTIKNLREKITDGYLTNLSFSITGFWGVPGHAASLRVGGGPFDFTRPVSSLMEGDKKTWG